MSQIMMVIIIIDFFITFVGHDNVQVIDMKAPFTMASSMDTANSFTMMAATTK